MGTPMVRNLLAAGHEVVGCDVDGSRAAELGVPSAATPAEAVAGAEIAITSLPSPEAVEHVALGAHGIRAGATGRLTLVEMSTSPPALARRLAAELLPVGIDVLDAPVSGGPKGAEAATLSIMCGGEAAVFERARPVLEALGTLVVRVGGPGAGQAAKLCNNLMAGANMVAIAEATRIAEREGIDAAVFYELVTNSTGDSRVLRNRYPRPCVEDLHPVNREFAAMFMVDLIAKDLTLAVQLAEEAGVDATVARAALAAYAKAQAAGLGALDYSAVYRVVDA